MKDVKFNRLYKVLLTVFLLALLASVITLAVACNCEHDYAEEITRQPDCSHAGEVTFTCRNCGDTYAETLPMSDSHSLADVYLTDADSHWQKCKNCDYVTEKTAHTLGYQQQGGKHWQECSVCHYATDKVDHQFNATVSTEPSTCVKQGGIVKSCVCGQTTTETLPLAEHSYTKIASDDTEHWYVCAVCNAEDASRSRTPHAPVYQQQGGKHWQECSVCHYATDKVDHQFNTTVSSETSTCVKQGSIVKSCVCGQTTTEKLPLAEHDLDKTAFSSPSTGSGHYYKCNLCGNDVAEPHTLADCDCPDGYNREATCYKQGHQDQQCSVCSFRNHFTTPMTDNHKWSTEWSSNGTMHWLVCTNGDGQCTAKNDETAHAFVEVTVAPTCTEDGSSKRQCTCGAVQSGSNKVLKATGHIFSEFVKTVKNPTCDETGIHLMRCSNCEQESEISVAKLGHDWSLYKSDESKHWKECSRCHAEQTSSKSNHTADINLDEVAQAGDCVTDRIVKHTCQICKGEYSETIKARGHNYVTDDPTYIDTTKFADPTCTEYGWYRATCSKCGDNKKIYQTSLGLADHDLTYFPAKAPTNTEDGWERHHYCVECKQYFSSGDASETMSVEDVYIRVIPIDALAELDEYAQAIPSGEVSQDYYKLAGLVSDLSADTGEALLANDDGDLLLITILPDVDYVTVNNKKAVIRGKLSVTEINGVKSVSVVDAVVVDVESADGEYDFRIESNHGKSDISIYAVYGNSTFYPNTSYYNCLMPQRDDTLTIYYSKFNPKSEISLVKVLVNGKPYPAQGGQITLKIEGDIFVQFEFSSYGAETSVRLTSFDTSNNDVRSVDGFLSYSYVGNYNSYGRIYQNSHLTFEASNAVITKVVITYKDHNVTGENTVDQNTVSAYKNQSDKISQTQNLDSNLQVTFTFNYNNGYVGFDYFADVCQARIAEITIYYQTNYDF